MITIQSNAIRGDYLYEIMDKTMKELHDDIVTVFGPYAKDAYLNIVVGNTYFVKFTNNPLNFIKKAEKLVMLLKKRVKILLKPCIAIQKKYSLQAEQVSLIRGFLRVLIIIVMICRMTLCY